MSIPLRVNDALFKEAEAEGLFMRRSAAKQVEFWAELGKILAQSVTSTDILALMQGIAQVRVELPESRTIEPLDVFSKVDMVRQSGALGASITREHLYYEVSRQSPGLLDEVSPDGSRRSGRFIDGNFIAE